jgi:hypothetical protein
VHTGFARIEGNLRRIKWNSAGFAGAVAFAGARNVVRWPGMSCSNGRICQLIVDQLSAGEKRVLSLTVAVRRAMARDETFKGNLQSAVRASLKKLVASRDVVDSDGLYSLHRR